MLEMLFFPSWVSIPEITCPNNDRAAPSWSWIPRSFESLLAVDSAKAGTTSRFNFGATSSWQFSGYFPINLPFYSSFYPVFNMFEHLNAKSFWSTGPDDFIWGVSSPKIAKICWSNSGISDAASWISCTDCSPGDNEIGDQLCEKQVREWKYHFHLHGDYCKNQPSPFREKWKIPFSHTY